jgi:hypothetical protein
MTPPAATAFGMRLLGAGVPLSLLIDLMAVDGPDSHAILTGEPPGRGRPQ